MAKQTSTFRPRGFRFAARPFVNADSTASFDIALAGADDSIVKSIVITSDDTSARNVQIIMDDGTTEHVLDTLPIPIASGTNGTDPAVDGLAATWLPLDSIEKKILPLAAGCTLKARMLVAVTAAKTVAVSAVLEDY